MLEMRCNVFLPPPPRSFMVRETDLSIPKISFEGGITVKLFVDDIRVPWEGWHLTRTITEAIRLLSTGHVDEISLDHDIQQTVFGNLELETFEPVARYIALMGHNAPACIYFHTANPAGGQRMANIIGIDYLLCRVDYAKFGKENI